VDHVVEEDGIVAEVEGQDDRHQREEEEEAAEISRLQLEGWQVTSADAILEPTFPYEGRVVKVSVDDDSRLVRGVVRAYLAPTADEPVALWKVWLEEDYGRQDLEEEELHAALC